MKLNLTASEMRYVKRLVDADAFSLTQARQSLYSGERVGVVPVEAEQVLEKQRNLAAAVSAKIDLAW